MHLKFNEIKSDLYNLKEAVKFVYRSDRKLFKGRIFLILFQSTLPLALLYLLKLLVDVITGIAAKTGGYGINDIWLYAGLFCGVFLLTKLSDILKQLNDDISFQKLMDYMSVLIQKKSTELDLAFYDNPEYHDAFHRAREEVNYRPVQILNNLTGIISSSISLASITIMLIAFSSFVIAVMIIAVLPSFFLKISVHKKLYEFRKENTHLYRKAGYFFDLMVKREYAKELRVYNLADYFRKSYADLREKIVSSVSKISISRSKLNLISAVVEAAVLIGIIVMLGNDVIAGAVTVGSFVMFFEAFRRGQGYMQGIVSGVSGLYENKLFLGNLFEFLKLEPVIKSAENPQRFPEVLEKGIKFEYVSFCYPGSEKRMIVENLSFEAKSGEIFKIKGENGSGKTTLMKLLCRLYDCTKGAIFIEGIDIRDFDLKELRKNIGVIFQDFAKYDFTARENIVLGNTDDDLSTGKLEDASRLSCAEPVIEKLPSGYETMLGKYFENGEELSMGQWQRIAIARALYTDAPILILDEPTSFIDAEAENKFYENLELLKKDKIIFVISHSVNTGMENGISYSIESYKSSK
ncbi:MAG: ABC transporter ATP-binding protein [Candidatus Kapaibacterium sp.]